MTVFDETPPAPPTSVHIEIREGGPHSLTWRGKRVEGDDHNLKNMVRKFLEGIPDKRSPEVGELRRSLSMVRFTLNVLLETLDTEFT